MPFSQLLKGEKLNRESEQISVSRHISLLLETGIGEYAYDRNYGSHIYINDYDSQLNFNNWVNEIKEDLKDKIQRYEPRILSSYIVDAKITTTMDGADEKKALQIEVKNLVLSETQESIDDIKRIIVFNPITIR